MNQTSLQKVHRQADHVFRVLFPLQGYTVREDQIRLCHAMVDALFHNTLALCDAGVGIGKTYAYLIACVLWREELPEIKRKPLVISTSSVALQDAILREYLPFLSGLLYSNDLISEPIHAVIRKSSPSLKEPVLHKAILHCIQSTFSDTAEVEKALKEAEKQFILYEDAKQNPAPLLKRMQEIDTEMSNLLLLATHSQNEDQFDNKFRSLTQEKAELQSRLDEITENASSDQHRQKQIEEIFGAITPELMDLTEFDDDFIRRIVQQITVLSAEKIEVRFLGGYCQIGDILK